MIYKLALPHGADPRVLSNWEIVGQVSEDLFVKMNNTNRYHVTSFARVMSTDVFTVLKRSLASSGVRT